MENIDHIFIINLKKNFLKKEKCLLQLNKNNISNYTFIDAINTINDNMPYNTMYNKCDIIYSEPAWKHGYDIFMNKAGFKKINFNEYVNDICKFLFDAKKPAIIITGINDSKLYLQNLQFKTNKNYDIRSKFNISKIVQVVIRYRRFTKQLMPLLLESSISILDYYSLHLISTSLFVRISNL